jgi:galactoside O-acetyltransferase
MLGERVQWRGILEKPRGGTCAVGDDSIIEGRIVLCRPEARVTIGARSFIGSGTALDCSTEITIGDDVLIAWGGIVMDHNSHSVFFEDRKDDVLAWHRKEYRLNSVARAATTIERRCWIGARVVILKGVTLGEGCVVGLVGRHAQLPGQLTDRRQPGAPGPRDRSEEPPTHQSR